MDFRGNGEEAQRADPEAFTAVQAVAATGQLQLDGAAAASQPPPSQAAPAAFGPAHAATVTSMQLLGLPLLPAVAAMQPPSAAFAAAQGVAAPAAAASASDLPFLQGLGLPAMAAAGQLPPPSQAALAAFAAAPGPALAAAAFEGVQPSTSAEAAGQPPLLAAAAAAAVAAAPFVAGHAQCLQGLPAHAGIAGQPPPLAAQPAAAAVAAADDDSAALLGYDQVAACSRGNLQQLLVSRAELQALVQVEKLLPDGVSVLSGLLVRVKCAGKYYLVPSVRLLAKAGGTPCLEVWSPAPLAASGDQPPDFRHVPIGSVSGTSPLTEEQWQATGQHEAAGLEALLRLHGVRLDLRETAQAVLGKRAGLVWHARHGVKPLSQQRQHVHELLRQLQDHASINWQECLLARQLHLQQAEGSPAQQEQGPDWGQVLPQAALPQQQQQWRRQQQRRQQQQPGALVAQQQLTPAEQQEFWRAAQPGMQAKRQEGGELVDRQLRQELGQPSAPAAAVVVEPLDWERLPRCGNCRTWHTSRWIVLSGLLECSGCHAARLADGVLPPVTMAVLVRRRARSEQLFSEGILYPPPLPQPQKQKEWRQMFWPQRKPQWQLLSQLLHPADSYGMQGRTTADAASEAGLLEAFRRAVANGAAGGADAVELPSGEAGVAAAVEALLAGPSAAQACFRLGLRSWRARIGPPAFGCRQKDWAVPEGESEPVPVPTRGQLEQARQLKRCITSMAEVLRRGPDCARYGPEHMPFADFLVSSSKLPNEQLPWEAKAAGLSVDKIITPRAKIMLAGHRSTVSEVPAVQLLCASRAANPVIVAMHIRPEGEYNRAARALVRPLQNKVALFILPFEVILRHAANQRTLSCNPYVDGDGRLWVRDTPIPWYKYAVTPAELASKIKLLWLEAVINEQTSTISGLLARYTARKLLEHLDLYSAGRLLVLVQPCLPMQLVQQRGQGDSLVCGRILEHKHATPGHASLRARCLRWSREDGAYVSAAYPIDRQDGFLFHLQHWDPLLDWLGVNWGVLTGLLVYVSRSLAKGLGLTVKKWRAKPARKMIHNPASSHPHLLLLCTTQLGFGPGHEWLQAQLQTGADGPAGLAACPPAPLPFPVAVALRSLLDQGYDIPGEPEAVGDEGDNQGVPAVGEVAQSRVSLLDALRQEDPEAYAQLRAAIEAEEAAEAAALASQEDPARSPLAVDAEAWGPEFDMAIDFEPAGGEWPLEAAVSLPAELDELQRRLDGLLAHAAPAAAGGPMERAAAAAADKAAAAAARDAACAEARRLVEGLARLPQGGAVAMAAQSTGTMLDQLPEDREAHSHVTAAAAADPALVGGGEPALPAAGSLSAELDEAQRRFGEVLAPAAAGEPMERAAAAAADKAAATTSRDAACAEARRLLEGLAQLDAADGI